LSVPDKELVYATQGATQGAILATPIRKAAWHTRPSWFVIASNDHMIAPDQQRSTAERMKSKTLTLPTSHLPMISQPEKVAEFIAAAIASLNTGG
jgi:pimeloyl-ACP methyl ester carboxylesterase